ncbi:uncharacterized protein B0H18DRAFT_956011 [Fomitopsis serialis]|uniref:uncharacterized protein n=1 Tax=Fomitopsis serialis TaxID=139415 RepID=UPI002008625E|nr:uncharacterized protein B0H18DRAFT_956011 [Neoantrodia serialis]KAH9923092.1 hypothetical protein B0H18DRAFT_956011 [Neoantrodia serialis]
MTMQTSCQIAIAERLLVLLLSNAVAHDWDLKHNLADMISTMLNDMIESTLDEVFCADTSTGCVRAEIFTYIDERIETALPGHSGEDKGSHDVAPNDHLVHSEKTGDEVSLASTDIAEGVKSIVGGTSLRVEGARFQTIRVSLADQFLQCHEVSHKGISCPSQNNKHGTRLRDQVCTDVSGRIELSSDNDCEQSLAVTTGDIELSNDTDVEQSLAAGDAHAGAMIFLARASYAFVQQGSLVVSTASTTVFGYLRNLIGDAMPDGHIHPNKLGAAFATVFCYLRNLIGDAMPDGHIHPNKLGAAFATVFCYLRNLIGDAMPDGHIHPNKLGALSATVFGYLRNFAEAMSNGHNHLHKLGAASATVFDYLCDTVGDALMPDGHNHPIKLDAAFHRRHYRHSMPPLWKDSYNTTPYGTLDSARRDELGAQVVIANSTVGELPPRAETMVHRSEPEGDSRDVCLPEGCPFVAVRNFPYAYGIMTS